MKKRVFLIPVLLITFLVVGNLIYSYNSPGPNFSLDFDTDYKGKVIVVGAGASGLTAAYTLEAKGIDVTVIEAQDVYGGRMKEAQDFADFPVDLGAEWIHENPSILTRIASASSDDVDVETITYSPRDVYEWGGELTKVSETLTRLYSEYKFKDTTWFDFFDTYIVPSVRDRIILGQPVSSIDYSGDQVVVSTVDNQTFQPKDTYSADSVIVTVPMTVLQNNYIAFNPALPDDKIAAINNVTVPDGIKVFVEFDEKFYPDILEFTNYTDEDKGHEKIYYDAAFGKDSDSYILGLFTVGPGADELVDLDDQQIKNFVLAELDEIYDGKASRAYVKHIVANWASTAYIEGAYSTEISDRSQTISTLLEPLNRKVYFAGEALSIYNQATVPGAAETGYNAARALLDEAQ
ncbi:MAG: NAD(P)/FAD-dependent oxidoreductase [Patescibacteria group bacterium]